MLLLPNPYWCMPVELEWKKFSVLGIKRPLTNSSGQNKDRAQPLKQLKLIYKFTIHVELICHLIGNQFFNSFFSHIRDEGFYFLPFVVSFLILVKVFRFQFSLPESCWFWSEFHISKSWSWSEFLYLLVPSLEFSLLLDPSLEFSILFDSSQSFPFSLVLPRVNLIRMRTMNSIRNAYSAG